jgi:hypothetical protein
MENMNMDYYKYWEDFVAQWYKDTDNAIMGWTNPDKEPAPLCNTHGGKKSSLYIPEPWWGNDGKQPLHSVVINFNPGGGGEQQERESIRKRSLYGGSYADGIVNLAGETGKKDDVWPKNTVWWHFTLRAKPVQSVLGLEPSLKSHLSVELIPWHTKDVKNVNYDVYLEHNIKAVYEHAICFAANESRRIVNDHLKNVVLLKTSGGFTKHLLQKLEEAHCCGYKIIAETNGGKGDYLEFSLDTWPGVRFISIWSRYAQNRFPVSQLKQIFTDLKIIK